MELDLPIRDAVMELIASLAELRGRVERIEEYLSQGDRWQDFLTLHELKAVNEIKEET